MKAKEKSVIVYISDYVFATLYGRIPFSKLSQENSRIIYHQQSLLFLAAAKCKDENQISPEHANINISDSGGLWKVNKDVVAIFSVAEAFFLIFD